MKTLGVMVLLVFVLAGCGGGGGPSYDGAKQVADAIGCGQYQADDQTTMFAAETGSCRFHEHYVSIDWFKDETSKDNYKGVADQMGGSVVLYGKNFAIDCVDSRNDCDAFKSAVGGDLG